MNSVTFYLFLLIPATWLAVFVYMIVRIFRDQCTKSHDYEKICEIIHKEHYVSRKGKEWDTQSIYDVFECKRCKKRILRNSDKSRMEYEGK